MVGYIFVTLYPCQLQPFDVRSLKCIFCIPEEYPVARGDLRLAESSLPKVLVLHIEKEMEGLLAVNCWLYSIKSNYIHFYLFLSITFLCFPSLLFL